MIRICAYPLFCQVKLSLPHLLGLLWCSRLRPAIISWGYHKYVIWFSSTNSDFWLSICSGFKLTAGMDDWLDGSDLPFQKSFLVENQKGFLRHSTSSWEGYTVRWCSDSKHPLLKPRNVVHILITKTVPFRNVCYQLLGLLGDRRGTSSFRELFLLCCSSWGLFAYAFILYHLYVLIKIKGPN